MQRAAAGAVPRILLQHAAAMHAALHAAQYRQHLIRYLLVNYKISETSKTVDLWGNVSVNVYAKFRCAPLGIKTALEIFRELTITTTTTTTTTTTANGF